MIRNIAEFEGSAGKQSPDNTAHRKEAHTHANQALSHRQASFHARQTASLAVSNTSIPSTGRLGIAPLTSNSRVRLTYIVRGLRPITLAFPQQTLTFPLNGEAHYPPNRDLQPLPIHSLDLSLEVTRTIEREHYVSCYQEQGRMHLKQNRYFTHSKFYLWSKPEL